MNFNLYLPNSKEYHQIMMKKHWQQKKRLQKQPTQHQDLSLSTYNPNRYSYGDNSQQKTVNRNSPYNTYQQINIPQNIKQIPVSDLSPTSYHRQKHQNITIDNKKMKMMIKDQLEQSVAEQLSNKRKLSEDWKKTKQIMSKQNGILDYLQKEENKRNQFIKKCLINQQIFQNKFVDDDSLKTSKIFQHIDTNYDPDVFNHLNDYYKNKQYNDNAEMWMKNKEQKNYLRQRKQAQKQQYGKYFDQKIKNEQTSKNVHNPLINPLQYHIDNPYLRRKMMKY